MALKQAAWLVAATAPAAAANRSRPDRRIGVTELLVALDVVWGTWSHRDNPQSGGGASSKPDLVVD
jgi:hypothetical protein